MLRLLLLRHAKSSWSEGEVPDRDRPLTARGRAAATMIGEYLREKDIVPARVLTSPAERARRTTEIALAALGASPDPVVSIVEELYDFGDGSAVIEAVRRNGGTAPVLLVVGHNPSMETAAHTLALTGHAKDMAAMRRKFPTAAMAVIDLPVTHWSEAGQVKGALTRFVKPKSLGAGA